MRFFAPALIFCGVVASSAQTPVVPHKIHFAGMTLAIRSDAQSEIQKDVDALTQSPKYFNLKVERARTYFPIIERIFEEERVPVDFKYLVLQESALISDAVSVSDAVGFWQFKDFTAKEMGLKVDSQIDERKNIAAASRAAAKYIKQNNFMFNNWLYALQAYQMGAGGVKRLVGSDLDGSRHMEITSETYWYVKKFLAHKIAFEEATKGTPQVKIVEHKLTSGGSLQAIADATSVDIASLKEFNKWVAGDAIPADRAYTVIIPSGSMNPDFSNLLLKTLPPEAVVASAKPEVNEEKEILINEVPVIRAKAGESIAALSERAGLSVSHFLKFNDLSDEHKVVTGGYYFKAKKRSKTEQDYHKLKDGETLWQVSQQYGVQVKRLRKLNHLHDGDLLATGTMLWLNASKPRENAILPSDEPVIELETDKVFDWSKSGKVKTTVPVIPAAVIEPVSDESHVVQEGETLYSIAKSFGISINELKLLNDLSGPADLKPGMTLKVAVDESVTIGDAEPVASGKGTVIHEVRSSDTIYSVARQYGVTIKDLMDENHKSDFSVSLGEKLKIPAR